MTASKRPALPRSARAALKLIDQAGGTAYIGPRTDPTRAWISADDAQQLAAAGHITIVARRGYHVAERAPNAKESPAIP